MPTPRCRVTADVRRIEFIALKVHVKLLHHIAVLFQILFCFPGSIFHFVPAGDILRAHRPRKSSEKPVTDDESRCGAIGVNLHVHVICGQVERWGHVRVLVQDVSTHRPGQKV